MRGPCWVNWSRRCWSGLPQAGGPPQRDLAGRSHPARPVGGDPGRSAGPAVADRDRRRPFRRTGAEHGCTGAGDGSIGVGTGRTSARGRSTGVWSRSSARPTGSGGGSTRVRGGPTGTSRTGTSRSGGGQDDIRDLVLPHLIIAWPGPILLRIRLRQFFLMRKRRQPPVQDLVRPWVPTGSPHRVNQTRAQ
jgi:hypothetical protein